MKQINYDNDEMIKRLKKNIRENERILFHRNIDIQKISNESRRKNRKENKNENVELKNTSEREKNSIYNKNDNIYSKDHHSEINCETNNNRNIINNKLNNNKYFKDYELNINKNDAFWIPLDQSQELNYSKKNTSSENRNSSEKSNTFWIPLDQSYELTYSQKQKAIKVNKRLSDRANTIKRMHEEDNMQSFINKDEEFNSWKPKFLPLNSS